MLFAHVRSASVADDGTILVHDDQGLHALNPDGGRKWSFLADRGESQPAVQGNDGTVVYATGNHLYAIQVFTKPATGWAMHRANAV